MAIPFNEALPLIREAVLKFDLTSALKWKTCKDPEFLALGLPKNLYDAYSKAEGWESVGHALGTNRISTQQQRKQFLPMNEAGEVLRTLGITSSEDYEQRCQNDPDNYPPPGVPRNLGGSYGPAWSWPEQLQLPANAQSSRIELIFDHVLRDIFPKGNTHIRKARGVPLHGTSGEILWVDSYISQGNGRTGLVIEYDGGHYHNSRHQEDKAKTENLVSMGHKVIRLRGRGLELIQKDWDISINESASHDAQILQLLSHLYHLEEEGHLALTDRNKTRMENWVHKKLGRTNFHEIVKNHGFLPMELAQEKATELAKAQGIKTEKGWEQFAKENPDLIPFGVPHKPSDVYGKGFTEAGGVGYWLGTGTISNQAKRERRMPFDLAIEWMRKQGIKSRADWNRRCEVSGWRPSGIPQDISSYGEEFVAIGKWDGIKARLKQAPAPKQGAKRR